MAVEQADLLLEVAALGQQKMKEEQVKQQPKQPEPEKMKPEQKPEPKAQTTKPAEQKQVAIQESVYETRAKLTKVVPQPKSIQQVQTEKLPPLQALEPVDTNPQKTAVESHAIGYGTEKEQHLERILREAYQQYTVNQDDQNELTVASVSRAERIPAKQPSEPAIEKPAREGATAAPKVVIEAVEQAKDKISTKTIPAFGFSETIDNTEDAKPLEAVVEPANEASLPVTEIVETDNADEQLELRFEPEVIDAYKELLALTEDEAAISKSSEISDNIIEPYNDTNVFATETVELDTVEPERDFEELAAMQTEAKNVMPLETIVKQADEQLLEQTLVQLAQYLTVALQENQMIDELGSTEQSYEIVPEQNEHFIELRAILRDISIVLPRSYYIDKETGKQRIKITPELTEQLFLLLHNLGYEHPREALIEFIRMHRLAYLLQALKYMCRLNNVEEKQEFLIVNSIPSSSDDMTVDYSALLGNAVIRLVSARPFSYGIATKNGHFFLTA